jgi:hypothetical protein
MFEHAPLGHRPTDCFEELKVITLVKVPPAVGSNRHSNKCPTAGGDASQYRDHAGQT